MALNPFPIYPSARRYVLRLHRDAAPLKQQLAGHIEHVASGDGTEFASRADLLDWLERHAAQECGCMQQPGNHPFRKDNP